MTYRHGILNRLLSGRLALRRPSGFMSTYPLSMFYGSWRADRHFRAKYPTGKPVSTPMFRVGRAWHGQDWKQIPAWLMVVFRPFNKYRQTQRGERFC